VLPAVAAVLRPSDPPAVHVAAFLAAVDAVDPSMLQDVPPYMIRSIPDPQHPAAPAMRVVCDAWGTPVDYRIRRDSPEPAPLFVSAGPNRRYDDEETSHDNIRSNEP